MDYYESLRFLYSLADFERTGRFADRKDVAPMLALLEELGDPHLGRVTVHIAGSKGKGSVAAMVESMLRAGGVTTGLTTSPHLQKITERVQIDGAPVSQEEFAAAADRHRRFRRGLAFPRPSGGSRPSDDSSATRRPSSAAACRGDCDNG